MRYLKASLGALVFIAGVATTAGAATCPYTYDTTSIAKDRPASAEPVMNNFNYILTCPTIHGMLSTDQIRLTSSDYSAQAATDGSWNGSWVTIIPPGTLAQGIWLISLRWDHSYGNGGWPWVVASTITLQVINTNGTGADVPFVPLTTQHTGGMTNAWQLRCLAGPASTTGLQTLLTWGTAGTLTITAHQLST